MIVVASSNGRVGIGETMRVLLLGGFALDSVEAGVKLVEDNLQDHTVGRGEMGIHAATARSVVIYMKVGMALADAVADAMGEFREEPRQVIARPAA